MKNKLNCNTLEARHGKLHLKLFYLSFHNQTGIDALKYFKSAHYGSKRNGQVFKLRKYCARADVFAYTFVIKSIKKWNESPELMVCSLTADLFYSKLCRLQKRSHGRCKTYLNKESFHYAKQPYSARESKITSSSLPLT